VKTTFALGNVEETIDPAAKLARAALVYCSRMATRLGLFSDTSCLAIASVVIDGAFTDLSG
jgi:hypothetical protein